jgi:hypothetical protein
MSYSKCARAGEGVGRSWPLTADPERSSGALKTKTAETLAPSVATVRYGRVLQDQRARHWEVGRADPSIPWPPHVGSFLSRSVLLDCYGYRKKLKFSRADETKGLFWHMGPLQRGWMEQ